MTFRWPNNTNVKAVPITYAYINNFIIDSNEWSRIRVPIADLFPGINYPVNVSRIFFNNGEYVYKTYYLDEIRIIGDGKKYLL